MLANMTERFRKIQTTQPAHKDPPILRLMASQARGFEFEVNGEITPNWNVFAGYSQTEAEEPDGTAIIGSENNLMSLPHIITRCVEKANNWWRRKMAK